MFLDTSGIGRKMVYKLSSGGVPYGSSEIIRMPRIPENYLDCVVYLYRSEDDARKGERGGGTGFLVCVPSAVVPLIGYVYAVTNAHVINGGAGIIRLNTKTGEIDAIPGVWIADPNGSDLAVCRIALNDSFHRYRWVPLDMFLTERIIYEFNIGIGDDVFMAGRFINHEGKQTNTPAVRFGNIAMMPREPIFWDGHEEQSFLVELRSISGYSGSPVFVDLPPFSRGKEKIKPGEPQLLEPRSLGPWLLGINRAYLHDRIPVREGKDKNFAPVGGSYAGWNVTSNTGMAAVIPAWVLSEVLNLPAIKAERDHEEELLAKKQADSGITETPS